MQMETVGRRRNRVEERVERRDFADYPRMRVCIARALFDPSLAVASEVARRAQAHGVITRGIGDTLSLCPPLIIDEALVDKLMIGVERALDDTYVWAREGGLMA